MSALAISDSVFLLQLVPPWLNTAGLSDVFLRAGFCQFFMYASYVSCGASSWLVVTFTLERLVAVKYPLRRNAVCTVARARLAATAIAVVALAFNTPVLRFAVPRDGYCSVDRAYLLAARRFNVIDTMLSFTTPLLVIVIVNILIVVDICRANNALHQIAGRVGSSPADDARSQRRVTTMLLKVSSVFVACNLPAYTFRLLAYDV
ncbi:jg20101, partial [Pararge aegeria aegeria]